MDTVTTLPRSRPLTRADVALPEDTDDLWTWRGRRYLFRALPAEEYQRHMRVRSPKWDTVVIPRMVYRELVRPFHTFLQPPQPVSEECPF